jgi:hypothetical protein
MRNLFEKRLFWIVLAVVLLGLSVNAFNRGERPFAVIYLAFLVFALARAAGWRMPRL